MKVRKGFVSNSSGSSFVIVLPPGSTAGTTFEEYAKKYWESNDWAQVEYETVEEMINGDYQFMQIRRLVPDDSTRFAAARVEWSDGCAGADKVAKALGAEIHWLNN